MKTTNKSIKFPDYKSDYDFINQSTNSLVIDTEDYPNITFDKKVYYIKSEDITNASINSNVNFFYELSSNIDVFRNIRENILNIPKSNVRDFAMEFTFIFQDIIINFNKKNRIVNYLPPLLYKDLEDGSIFFEWVFKDFRIGFTFEPDVNDSNWYLVTSRALEEVEMSGLIVLKEVKALLFTILLFVLRNS